MTKKHFDAIAETMKARKPADGMPHGHASQWEGDCEALADTLGRFNANFSKHRFLVACGVGG